MSATIVVDNDEFTIEVEPYRREARAIADAMATVMLEQNLAGNEARDPVVIHVKKKRTSPAMTITLRYKAADLAQRHRAGAPHRGRDLKPAFLRMRDWSGPVPLPGDFCRTPNGRGAYRVLGMKPGKGNDFRLSVERVPLSEVSSTDAVHIFVWLKRVKRGGQAPRG